MVYKSSAQQTSAGSGGGSVSSVGLSMPVEFNVVGSPVTGSGTITVSKATENANLVYASSATSNGVAPTFRALVVQDIPLTPQTLTYSSSITWNATLGLNATIACTATGNFTLGLPAGLHSGYGGMITITQAATGGQVITWASGFRGAGGTKPTLSTGANNIDEIAWYSPDGSHIDLVGQLNFS